jgi:hypothetical protein
MAMEPFAIEIIISLDRGDRVAAPSRDAGS